jgi:hypothetical protein
MMRSFDLVGTIHGREYSDYGEYVTADDYYHLMLHGEAVARLKLGLEEENEQLKKEIAEMKEGIDPKWGLMDQSILVDYLREQTNFCAEKFDGMIQFAVDAANREYK